MDDHRSQFQSSVGKLVQTITLPVFGGNKNIQPQNLDALASYNWMNEVNPTIIVPGAPPKWTPPSRIPVSIPQDRGFYYIDQGSFRYPKYHLEPLFRAIFLERPEFDMSSIDLVTDRNNLRKLMEVISGDREEKFRIDIDFLGGKTMLFTRWEEKNCEIITEFRGFGHSFERRFTKYADKVRGSSGHHRIVQYNLGGLKVVVRYLVDAYISDGVFDKGETFSSNSVDLDAITSSLQNIRLEGDSKDTENADSKTSSTLRVIPRGYKVPQTFIVELKTRASHKIIKTEEVIHQLWFAQVRHLIIGYHSRGKFLRIERKNFVTNGEFRNFEEMSTTGGQLRRLVKLIEAIKKTMKERELTKAALLYEGGILKLYERNGGGDVLPADLLAKWKKAVE